MSILQKISDIEYEISRTQKNKATNAHIGLLKAKLAKLKNEILNPKSSGGSNSGPGFDVSKTGDARVGLIGFPSVGKSTLLTKLTGTHSEVADYEFTTLTAVPGTLQYKGCRIQLIDLPGIIEGAKDGKGRGRQVIAVARTCNLILIVLDASKPLTHKRIIERELEGFGIRLNQKPPAILLKKKERGGISITLAGTTLSYLDKDAVIAILKEYKISNCDVTFKCDATADQLIDAIEGNRIYTPTLYIINKIDSITLEELNLLAKVPHYVPISAMNGWGFDLLLESIWEYLHMTRLYTKPKGQVPNYNEPVVVPVHKRTVADFCNRIHRSLRLNFKYAWVWGSSVKHNPQKVGLDHTLNDEDVVQVVKKI